MYLLTLWNKVRTEEQQYRLLVSSAWLMVPLTSKFKETLYSTQLLRTVDDRATAPMNIQPFSTTACTVPQSVRYHKLPPPRELHVCDQPGLATWRVGSNVYMKHFWSRLTVVAWTSTWLGPTFKTLARSGLEYWTVNYECGERGA
jgi:hypothetical protein